MAAKRILIVDDEPNVVKSCARMLELEGFETQGVTDGAEAIELYKQQGFDLVLADLKMPGVDGLQVLREIREYDPGATVAIITAYGTKESVVEAFRSGACEFLEKPLRADTLISTVRRILAHEGDDRVVRGNLRTLSLPSIVQVNCAEGNLARLRVRHQGREGSIYFADGNVVHAEMDGEVGEEVVYELLTREDGDFFLEMGVEPPRRTITTNWSGLLLEGMRRIDESNAAWDDLDELDLATDAPPLGEETAEIPDEFTETEVKGMATKKRSELLAETLDELISTSTDIEGGALVGIDGLVLSANVPIGKLDETLVGATAAAISGLSRRSVEQMKRGEFFQTLIQGSKGNIIVTFVDERNVFVGLTPADVNLGMAFYEARQVAEKLRDILK